MSQLLNEALIVLELKATTQEEAIDELIHHLYQAGRIKRMKPFKKAILKRESLSSTGFGDGIAIPHAKDKSVRTATIVLGRSLAGIPYNSHDNEPVNLLFMIATPPKTHDVHLDVLSQLARRLMHEDFKTSLMNANSKEEVLEILKDQ